jgi:hypothetical protein
LKGGCGRGGRTRVCTTTRQADTLDKSVAVKPKPGGVERGHEPVTPKQVGGELGRGSQGGDRLPHELEPLDRVQRDDRVPGVLDRDRPVAPREHEPHPRDLSVEPDQPPLDRLRRPEG